MAYGNNITLSFLMTRLNKELNVVYADAQGLREVADDLYNNGFVEYAQLIHVKTREIEGTIKEWKNYISKYKEVTDKEDLGYKTKLEEANRVIDSLRGQLKTYNKLLKEKDNKQVQYAPEKEVDTDKVFEGLRVINDKIKTLDTNINTVVDRLDLMIVDKEQYDKLYKAVVNISNKYRSVEGLSDMVDTLQDTLDLIEENSKLIAGSKGNREKQSKAVGKDSNRFIQELDTEILIKDYKENNYTITKQMKEKYSRKFGITYNGLRERLIKANVWVGKSPKQ